MKIFVSKENEWYDSGTIAVILCDLGYDTALFLGTKDGKLDEEICHFDEFEIIEYDGAGRQIG